jgi:curved DNA-binding protein CbpA
LDAKGYYAMLGVSEKSSYIEIKRAYRRLARKYHPDRNNSSFAEDMIKKLNMAFEILSDDFKRREYDEMSYDNNMPDEQDHTDPSPDQARSNHSPGNTDHANFDVNYGNARSYDATQATITQFLDVPKGRFHISVEPSLCMAFGTCERIAPRIFTLDKNKRINPKAKVESEVGVDFETLLAAAQNCPTRAIRIVDRYTGEQIYP